MVELLHKVANLVMIQSNEKTIKRHLVLTSTIFFCLLPVNVSATGLERPSLITESFFAPRHQNHAYPYVDSDPYHGNDKSKENWIKMLREQGIELDARRYDEYCNFNRALEILQDIRQTDPFNARYERQWIINQNKVCTQRRPDFTKLAHHPKRALSDFQYQMGTFHLYREEYDQALAYYTLIAANKDAPTRPYAAYMVARTLRLMGRSEKAYDAVEAIARDESLERVHNLANNYRFIVANQTQIMYPKPRRLVEKHFNWLLEVIQRDPLQSDNEEQAISDYFDAHAQLDLFFPLKDRKSGRIDWWLQNVSTETSPRLAAVKKAIKQNEIVDWMQASWAYNIFDDDWLLSLHFKKNPYWEQNENIVQHAWSRWKKDDGLEWLEIAIQRVDPHDPLSHEIQSAVKPFLERSSLSETWEYKGWLRNVWAHSIRVHLGHENHGEALDLFQNDAFAYLVSDPKYYWINRRGMREHIDILSQAIRWLIYTGHVGQARQFLERAKDYYPDSFGTWTTLLATRWEDAAPRTDNEVSIWAPYYPESLWLKMLNLFPAETLYQMAQAEERLPRFKQILSWAVFTRAMLLDDDENIDRYAQLAADQNAVLHTDILKASTGKNRRLYVDLMLRVPRFRPVPFTKSSYDFSYFDGSLTELDYYNHNDNNWWCAVDRQTLERQIFEAARIEPRLGWPGSSYIEIDEGFRERFSVEVDAYNQNIQSILDQHPYKDFVDMEEVSALERIPSGPRYLSNAAIDVAAWAWWRFWEPQSKQEAIAENLHYAVRTTRYGCQNNGSHAEYSRAAFSLLHKSYADTKWAQATPYWFSDKHFREEDEYENEYDW